MKGLRYDLGVAKQIFWHSAFGIWHLQRSL